MSLFLDAAEETRRRCRPRWPWSSSLRNISTPVTTVFLRVAEADDLDLFADLDDAALDATRDDRAAALDREHVLDRHQERLVDVADRVRDVAVEASSSSPIDSSHFASPLSAGSAATCGRPARCRRGTCTCEELADFHLDEVQHLRVVDRVALVQRRRRCAGDRPGERAARARASAA